MLNANGVLPNMFHLLAGWQNVHLGIINQAGCQLWRFSVIYRSNNRLAIRYHDSAPWLWLWPSFVYRICLAQFFRPVARLVGNWVSRDVSSLFVWLIQEMDKQSVKNKERASHRFCAIVFSSSFVRNWETYLGHLVTNQSLELKGSTVGKIWAFWALIVVTGEASHLSKLPDEAMTVYLIF